MYMVHAFKVKKKLCIFTFISVHDHASNSIDSTVNSFTNDSVLNIYLVSPGQCE